MSYYQEQILSFLRKNPQWYSTRDISRETKIATTRTNEVLNSLLKFDLVMKSNMKKIQGNQKVNLWKGKE